MIEKILDNPFAWRTIRSAQDFLFGIYKKRIKLIKDLGLVKDDPSVLDLGCGMGQFAEITNGDYLGIDLNPRYIKYALEKKYKTKKVFRCSDLTTLRKIESKFDIVLMVDILHHLSDKECINLLKTVSEVTIKYLISYEPIAKGELHFIDKFLRKYDRGKFIRPLDELNRLFRESGFKAISHEDIQLGFQSAHLAVCCIDNRF